MTSFYVSEPRTRPPVNHSRRSWSNNSVHYQIETSSFVSPGFSFEVHNGSSNNVFPRPQRTQSSGLLGTAFGLIGDVLAAKQQQQQQQQQQAIAQEHNRRSRRQPYAEDLAYGDDDEEGDSVRRRPKSLFGSIAERFITGQQQRQRRSTRSREQSPVRRGTQRPRADVRQRSYQDQERRPSWRDGRTAYVEDDTDDEETSESESSDDEVFTKRKPRRAFTANDASMIQALENAVEHHRREARSCRKKIETASRNSVPAAVLHKLVNEMQTHEKAHNNAMENLRMLKQGTSTNQTRQQPAHSSGSAKQERSTTGGRDEFAHPLFADDSDPFFQTRRNTHAGFGEFDNSGAFGGPFNTSFNSFFGDNFEHPFAHFFAMPQATFSFSTNSSGQPRTQRTQTGPQPQPPPVFPTFSPPAPAKPPAALLKPEEAKRVFKTYNERWNALQPTDPNIPYPGRGLKSSALVARDSIWAPYVGSPIATWSEETVMQANAQAFYLGVVGLSPQYTEALPTGKLAMGFNKAKANPAQTKELVDILKKEKMRWHSDRLGRRNGGVEDGPNETLQSDERARAVFHAVCELMDVAQGA